ncbi:major capsid protein [Xenophilus sp. Marseille-Q4582]|uniref:major capsid protein n=1 Tax=Xenophilus sp. Marseille-Q4582 TaxID=2866600 RepID=UPI001CE48DF6|nr:major capsid protein [Xenophilus sp. Marseille-Q4582]
MNRINRESLRYGALAAGAALASSANAAAIDVADLVTDIGAQAAPVGLVGVAVLMIYGAVRAFKWVRAALS